MAVAASEALNLLYQPLQIKGLTLKNRVVYPPMVVNYAAQDGSVTDRSRAYYAARAKGGVALVIVEASYVLPTGRAFYHSLGVDDDRKLPGLRSLADAIHKGGALAAIQLWHAGRRCSPAIIGTDCVSSSNVPGVDGYVPRPLTLAEIAEVAQAFGQAARRAKEAGFDIVEVHSAHGYLLNQFLSPLVNHREDEYGGSLENRMRFPLQVMASVRRAVGEHVPIIVRLSAEEYVAGGLTLAETPIIARRMQEAGADVISVSGGSPESTEMGPTGQKKGCAKTPQGYYRHLAAAMKSNVTVPVIGVGRLNNPYIAAQVLVEEQADLVAVGRGLFADPEWVNKVAQGREAEIRRCTCCNGCLREIYQQLPVKCKQNKELGQEYLL